MRRATTIALASGALAAAAVAVVVLEPWAPAPAAPPSAPPSASAPAASPGSPEALAQDLAVTLASGDQAAVAAVFAAPADQLDPGLAAALAPLQVEPDPATFVEVDASTATVEASTAGPDGPGRWTVYLTRSAPDAAWLIAATAPLGTQP